MFIKNNLAITNDRLLMLNFVFQKLLPKENPPLLAGDFHFFAGVYKPNSVSFTEVKEITICLGPTLL